MVGVVKVPLTQRTPGPLVGEVELFWHYRHPYNPIQNVTSFKFSGYRQHFPKKSNPVCRNIAFVAEVEFLQYCKM